MGYIMGCITLYNQRDMSFWFGACFSFTRNWLIKRKNKTIIRNGKSHTKLRKNKFKTPAWDCLATFQIDLLPWQTMKIITVIWMNSLRFSPVVQGQRSCSRFKVQSYIYIIIYIGSCLKRKIYTCLDQKPKTDQTSTLCMHFRFLPKWGRDPIAAKLLSFWLQSCFACFPVPQRQKWT